MWWWDKGLKNPAAGLVVHYQWQMQRVLLCLYSEVPASAQYNTGVKTESVSKALSGSCPFNECLRCYTRSKISLTELEWLTRIDLGISSSRHRVCGDVDVRSSNSICWPVLYSIWWMFSTIVWVLVVSEVTTPRVKLGTTLAAWTGCRNPWRIPSSPPITMASLNGTHSTQQFFVQWHWFQDHQQWPEVWCHHDFQELSSQSARCSTNVGDWVTIKGRFREPSIVCQDCLVCDGNITNHCCLRQGESFTSVGDGVSATTNVHWVCVDTSVQFSGDLCWTSQSTHCGCSDISSRHSIRGAQLLWFEQQDHQQLAAQNQWFWKWC